MLHCLRRVVLTVFTACLLCFTVQAKDWSVQSDSSSLPVSLSTLLTQLHNEDKLEDWLYARIDYTDKAPFERIGFLMATQRDAWRSYQNLAEREAWFNLLILQGYYQLQTGNILASINAYETAREFYESYPLSPAFIDEYLEFVLKPLGNNYTRLADYHSAFYIHEKTVSIASKHKYMNAAAAAWSNLAICSRWNGDLNSAAQYCKEGIRQVNKKTPLFGLILSTWAEILSEQQRTDTALIVCEGALHQLKPFSKSVTGDDQPLYWYTSALQTAARIYLQQQQYNRAMAYSEQALQIFNQHYPEAKQREKAKIRVLMGDIFLAAGQYVASGEKYQQALQILLPAWHPQSPTALPPDSLLYSENTLSDALAGKAAALEGLNNLQASLDHYLAIFRASRKLRAAFYYTESKLKDLQLLRLRAEAAMSLAYRLWFSTQQPKYRDQVLLIAELSKAQVLLEEREARSRQGIVSKADSLSVKAQRLQEAIAYYQYEWMMAKDKTVLKKLLDDANYELSLVNKKIKHRPGMQESTAIPDETRLQKIMGSLPDKMMVLQFFEGSRGSYIIELNREGIQAIHLAPGSDQLRSTVQPFMQQWFARGPSAMLNDPAAFYQQAARLYKMVFGQYVWEEGYHYLLVPDGVFNYIPFDALPTNDRYKPAVQSWPFLVRKVSLSQAWSIQTWYEQQEGNYQDGRFGAFFVSKGRGSSQPLPAIEKEQALLKNKIPGRYFENGAATWQVFNQLADSLNVLHIGTHAVSSAQDSFPFLQLYDRPFYLFDLQHKNFSPSLVVLGACKTADGALLEGEGVNSLGRGFTAAGAGGVLSGLWNVNDEAGAGLMALFYDQLSAGEDPGVALHLAKLQWLQEQKDNTILQLPYYWAGMVYSGRLLPVELQEISFVSKYGWTMLIGLTVIILLCLSIKLVRRKK